MVSPSTLNSPANSNAHPHPIRPRHTLSYLGPGPIPVCTSGLATLAGARFIGAEPGREGFEPEDPGLDPMDPTADPGAGWPPIFLSRRPGTWSQIST
eukprot:1194297-Prorocentrum_minimum.AAC.4